MKKVPTIVTLLMLSAAAFAAEPPSPPLTYNAVANDKYYPKPELPKIGPAPFLFKDPTFNCPMIRVTDEKTFNGDPILTPAGAVQNTFNTDSTLFVVQSNGGRAIPFAFDPTTLKASRIEGLDTLPNLAGDTPFSYREKDVCYGKNVTNNALVKFNFATRQTSEICDLAKLTGIPFQNNRIGTLTISANDILATCFGGAGQNRDIYVIAYDINKKTFRIWDTDKMTIDGKPVEGAVQMTVHACAIDPSGRYVMVTPGRGSRVRWIWDTEKATVTPIDTNAGGHAVLGYGVLVNDDHRFFIRNLDPDGIKSPKPIMSHPAGQRYFRYDSHSSWNNTRADKLLPVLASTYHAKELGDPQCPYGDEVFAVATDGSQKIWRFCHTRTIVHAPSRDASGAPSMPADRTNIAASQPHNFWDSSRGNVSQDGRFFMFNSNWEETLGKDRAGRFRQDVFIVKLEQSE